MLERLFPRHVIERMAAAYKPQNFTNCLGKIGTGELFSLSSLVDENGNSVRSPSASKSALEDPYATSHEKVGMVAFRFWFPVLWPR